jgi:hypothetical protein
MYHPFKIVIISTIIVLSFYPGFTQNPVGTTAAEFLGIAVGPRAYAMGGAYTAMISDVTSAYWNPGALAFIDQNYISLSQSNWLLGTTFNWAGISMNLGNGNVVAANMTYLDYGEEEVTTIYEQEGTNQYWSAVNMAVNISYARALTKKFALGGTAKLIHERIWHETATGFAVDFGILYITDFDGMRLGMSISNYGTKMHMDGEDLYQKIDIDPENLGNNETIVAKLETGDYALPIFFRVGLAYDLKMSLDNRLTLAVDAIHPSNNTEYVNVGAEYAWNDLVFIRGGYKSLFQEDSRESFTVGGGLQYYINDIGKIIVDYSYAYFKDLDEDIPTFAFSFSF